MYNLIYKDLRKYSFIYIILCISMMPLIANGYSMYVLICLFPYVFKNRYNTGSSLIIFFSLFYTISFFIRGEILSTSKIVFYLLFPVIIYSCGNILGAKLRSGKSIIFVIISLVFCLAVPGIYFSIIDVIKSGEIIKISREIEYAKDYTLSATAYGVMFSLAIAGVAMILVPAVCKFDKKVRFFMFSLSLLAIFCTVHILNRTGLALAVIAVISTIFIPPYNSKRLLYTLFVCGTVVIISYVYFSDSPLMNDAIQGYISREGSEDFSTATGGGRFNRWVDALCQIAERPIGGQGYVMGDRINYAHNLWLDAGLRGGTIPFILLIVIAFQIFKYTILIHRKKILDSFESCYLIILCIVMLAQAMTEPVIEGVYQFFLFMIFFYGYVTALKNRKKLE